MRLTVGHAFERLGLHRVSLYVFTHTPRAQRAYEKAGFVAEGVERQTLWQDGEWIDAVRMSILAPRAGRPSGAARGRERQLHGWMTVTPLPGAVSIAARAAGAAASGIVEVTRRSGRRTPARTSSSISG